MTHNRIILLEQTRAAMRGAVDDVQRRVFGGVRFIEKIQWKHANWKAKADEEINDLVGAEVSLRAFSTLTEFLMSKIDDEVAAFIAAEKAKVASLTQQVADLQAQIAAGNDRTVSADTEAAVVAETAALTPPTA